jgi:hypothetical protein
MRNRLDELKRNPETKRYTIGERLALVRDRTGIKYGVHRDPLLPVMLDGATSEAYVARNGA